jgi:cyclic pyranopterin phosphate synthase
MLPSPVEMTPQELEMIVRLSTEFGVTDVKLTGGEPLMREDLEEIIRRLHSIPNIRDISMTTNASSLASRAASLRRAGLQRVNINLLSLNPSIYRRYTGGDLEETKRGIEAAISADLNPIKVNMLILKDVNSQEVPAMMKYCSTLGAILQILELEQVNITDEYYEKYHFDLSGIERMLERKARTIQVRERMQNRKVYHLPNVQVEVVHPMENTSFCAKCTRLRLTTDGKLKPCLMRNDNLVDILTPLRKGATKEELRQLFTRAVISRAPFFQTRQGP